MREIEQLEYIINGAETRRWHTVPVLRDERVDSHSFNVAWLCFILQGGNVRPHLLLAALAHDLPEHLFGDIPNPSKRAMGPERAAAWDKMELDSLDSVGLNFDQYLTDEERRVLKLADVLSYGLYVLRERQMGNQLFGTIWDRIRNYLTEVAYSFGGREMVLVNWLDDMWKQANG